VLAGLAAILVTLGVMTDAAMFRGRYIITTNVPNASGIRKGDPVQMHGVNIGRILGKVFTIIALISIALTIIITIIVVAVGVSQSGG